MIVTSTIRKLILKTEFRWSNNSPPLILTHSNCLKTKKKSLKWTWSRKTLKEFSMSQSKQSRTRLKEERRNMHSSSSKQRGKCRFRKIRRRSMICCSCTKIISSSNSRWKNTLQLWKGVNLESLFRLGLEGSKSIQWCSKPVTISKQGRICGCKRWCIKLLS